MKMGLNIFAQYVKARKRRNIIIEGLFLIGFGKNIVVRSNAEYGWNCSKS
jgi:hypothetical protein